MSLTLYKKKRNFKNTPEPVSGKSKGDILHFVIQRHDATRLHYDFRLEMDGVLKSWAVPKGPSLVAGEKRLAVMVEDHPLDYGKFYGEIPEGNYGTGTVDLWDNGTYVPLIKVPKGEEEKSLLAQLKKGDLKFTLKGKNLKGAFALVRINDESGKNWLLIKKSDDEALKKYDIEKISPIKEHGNKKWISGKKSSRKNSATKTVTKKSSAKKSSVKASVKAKEEKQTVSHKKETIAKAWTHLQKPMLAKLVDAVKNDSSFIYEMKYDGYRAITKISKGKVEMQSRNGNSFNKQYDSLIQEVKKIEEDVILDGEVVIEDGKGRSNFQSLQNFTSTNEGILKYYVFDILFLNGHRLTGLPLKQWKELLNSFFAKYKFTNVIESPFVEGKGEQLLKKLTAKGYEGIIAKDYEATYSPGRRSDSWQKIKTVQMQEAVICGYTLPQNSRKYFGSLILGMYDGNNLVYIGNCGTGFTNASLEELHKKFSKLEIEKSPFKETIKMFGLKGKPKWMKPQLVCNVKFLEWTNDKHLRNPVFMGLRTDKKAKEVIREDASVKKKKENTREELSVKGGKLKLTNPSKIYWPGENITKRDLVNYYQKISKYILPYLKDRPQSLNRHPNGIKAPGFYQKDMDVKSLPDFAKTAKLYSKSNKKFLNYLLCNDEATLMYMANLGCIEINPWHSKFDNPDHPSYMILDLDPGKISFEEVVNTALVIKEICDELKISCYCKTSGATGLHVYIPLGEKYDYDEIKTFAELLATLTHQRLPKTTSIERSVAKRVKKIYVDFLQNRKGQTIAAAYSVRPKPGATVSTPLDWKEVNKKLSPQQFNIFNIEERIKAKGDLWKDVLKRGISLDKVLKNMQKLILE